MATFVELCASDGVVLAALELLTEQDGGEREKRETGNWTPPLFFKVMPLVVTNGAHKSTFL